MSAVTSDPYVILGVDRDASLREISAAWRRLAKEWHPDLRGDANALGRMVQVNAAYEQILAERTGRVAAPSSASAPVEPDAAAPGDGARPRGRGWWLDPHLRLALGAELLQSLNDQEQVEHVAPCEVGGSAGLLVVTDRRLLWLLDDNVLGRVRSIPFAAITAAERPPTRPWRRSAAVRVSRGRSRVTFAGLEDAMAERILRAIASARPAAAVR
jgi:DnaJ domain